MATRLSPASRRKFRIRTVFVSTLVAAATGAAVLPATGSAAPPPSLSQVQARINALADQVNVISEQYDAAREALAVAKHKSAALQRELTQARHGYEAARTSLDELAAAEYVRGGVSEMTLLLSDNPTEFLSKAASMHALSARQVQRLTEVEAARRRLDAAVQQAGHQLAKQQAIEHSIKTKRDHIAGLLAQQRQVLDHLQAQQRQALAAAHNRDVAAARAQRGTYSGPATGRAGAAVRFAYAQLGRPYVWGAAGPDAFDCSGLTMAAWAAAGLSLPHNAAAQYAASQPVSMSALQPGDLVFRGSPAYHVGLYVGGGKVIEAPHTGDVVKVIGVGYFQYAGRP